MNTTKTYLVLTKEQLEAINGGKLATLPPDEQGGGNGSSDTVSLFGDLFDLLKGRKYRG